MREVGKCTWLNVGWFCKNVESENKKKGSSWNIPNPAMFDMCLNSAMVTYRRAAVMRGGGWGGGQKKVPRVIR